MFFDGSKWRLKRGTICKAHDNYRAFFSHLFLITTEF